MAEADTLQQQLLAAQNSDGGWGYQKGSSWTEPTALALLAVMANGGSEAACARGLGWLTRSQKPDGGWAPQPSVEESTWVTSLAVLALAGEEGTIRHHRRGLSWLVRQTLPADTVAGRFVSYLQGSFGDYRPAGGSPWFPGTAAWVSPTAMSLLALSDEVGRNGDTQLRACVVQAQQFIRSRRCRDGGWNHGGSKYHSEDANSYPETTGMALLALGGTDISELLFPLKRALQFAASPTSSEALSWLQLGLLANGRDCRDLEVKLPCRTLRDVSLRLLALAGKSGTNKLLTS